MPDRIIVPVPTFSSEPGPTGEQPQGSTSAITPLTSLERLLPPVTSVLSLPM